MHDALQRIGFRWLTHVTMTVRPGGAAPTAFLATYAHRDWASQYFDNALWHTDRRHTLAGRSTSPLLWSLETLAGPLRADTESDWRALEVLEAMARHGVRCGVFFALPSIDPHEYAIVSLTASDDSCDWIDDAILGQAMILATSVHELVSGAARTRASLAISVKALTVTQRRVLECLCHGLGDKRIATELGMTTHNVDYHLRALRRRFGARNRVQLAQMATVQFLDSAPVWLDSGLGE